MFVCQRPASGGTFPSKADKLFYKYLSRYGFEDAHITDLVKCSDKAGKLDSATVRNCLPILVEEIGLLKPDLIVAVGKDTEKEIEKQVKPRLDPGVQVEEIYHYSYVSRYGREKKLRKQMRRIAKLAGVRTR